MADVKSDAPLSLEGVEGDEPEAMTFTYKNELYVVMGILSFLSVMGTSGNALVIYVFSQKKDKLVSTLFILVLAFVDFSTCLVIIPYTMFMEFSDFAVKYDIVCKMYHFLITSNIPFSALIMVAIAIDRYFCICHPFLHALNLQRAKIMSVCMALFAFSLGVVVALMFGVTYAFVPLNTTLAINGSSGGAGGGITPVTAVTSVIGVDVISGGGVAEASRITADGYNVSDASSSSSQFGNVSMATSAIHVASGNTTWIPVCDIKFNILSPTFLSYYLKVYSALYLVCLITVIVLYTLIYRSVLARRTKRQKQKSKSLPLVQLSSDPTADCTTENTHLTAVDMNGDSPKSAVDVVSSPNRKNPSSSSASAKNGSGTVAGDAERRKELREREKQRRKSMKRDRNRMANLKTAAMLFVVTLVFILTFLPACLMGLMYIPSNMTIFYMYFANNVANPVIYSFMNKNFRDDLRKLFCRR